MQTLVEGLNAYLPASEAVTGLQDSNPRKVATLQQLHQLLAERCVSYHTCYTLYISRKAIVL